MTERYVQDHDGTIYREINTGLDWLTWFVVQAWRNQTEFNLYLKEINDLANAIGGLNYEIY